MEVRYIITETIYCNGEHTRRSYGICAISSADNITVVKSINDLTTDKNKAEFVANLCNEGQLSPIHLRDVAEDFFLV